MSTVLNFLTRRRGRNGFDLTDWLTWAYLILGTLLMFGPVLWVVLSSFKTDAALAEYPPTLLPLAPKTVAVAGLFWLLILFGVTLSDYMTRSWIGVPGR